MLPGFNHNIRYREIVFHVQTEDSGPGQYMVVTQLFLGGHVLAVERFRYDDLWGLNLDDQERRAALKGRMQEQHKAMLRRLTEGHLDDRVEPFMGSTTGDTEEVTPTPEPDYAFDDALPAEILRAAEPLPVAPPALPDPAAAASARGARTSVLRPPSPSSAELREISVEGLVDNLEEWSAPPVRADPHTAQPRPAPSAQDTIVDARLPAALRAAQERLRKQAASRPPASPGRGAATFRRVEVRDARPPTPPPRAAPTTPPSPPRGRPNIPTNDKTMLEIDPLALKQAMARQRAQLEAQKKSRGSQDLEPTRRDRPSEPEVVAEPSLDEVIMSYLKDQD
jgi:hypothetical protein